jgi:hypothetical protein
VRLRRTDYTEQMLQLSRAMGNDFQYSVALLRLGLMRVDGGDVAQRAHLSVKRTTYVDARERTAVLKYLDKVQHMERRKLIAMVTPRLRMRASRLSCTRHTGDALPAGPDPAGHQLATNESPGKLDALARP